MQEVIILTISTVYWEEDSLSAVNVVGMVVCVGGIALHVTFKILRARSEEHLYQITSSLHHNILYSLFRASHMIYTFG